MHNVFPDLERSIKSDKLLLVKGRIDAVLGNLMIEFEANLKGRKLEEEAEFQIFFNEGIQNK